MKKILENALNERQKRVFGTMIVVILFLIFGVVFTDLSAFNGPDGSGSYLPTAVSPAGVNDVWGTLVDEDHLLLIRQETGTNHIRGFESTIILYTISTGEERVLFESGKVDGIEDPERKMVINNPPRLDEETGEVSLRVIESLPMEFLPLNAMHTAIISLADGQVRFEASGQGRETRMTEDGELEVSGYTYHPVHFHGPGEDHDDGQEDELYIEHNYTANTQKLFREEDGEREFLAVMSPSTPFYIQNGSMLYENDHKFILRDLSTDEELVLYDFSGGVHTSIKAVYGLTAGGQILMSSKEDNFFLYDPIAQSWELVAASGVDYTMNGAVYNNQGRLIHDEGQLILLQRVDRATGDGSLYVHRRPDDLMTIGAGTQIPRLGEPEGETADKEVMVGTRKGNLAPDFELVTVGGEEVSLRDVKAEGQSIILYAWATWCPSCSREFPIISEVYDPELYPNVEFVAVNIDLTEDDDIILQYQEKKGLEDLPFAAGTQEFLVAYKVRSTSTKYVIGADGSVLYTGSGVLKKEDWQTIFNAVG